MKKRDFGDQSIGIFCDWMASVGLMQAPKGIHHSAAEREQVKRALEVSSDQLHRGYQLILDEVRKNPTWTDKLNDFTLDPLVIAQLKKAKGYHELMSQRPCLQDAFQLKPEVMSEIFRIGMERFHRKHYEEASEVFLFALYLNPFVAWFWQGLARSWEGLHLHAEALHAYGIALNCEPLDTELYRCAVKLCLQAKDREKAQTLLEYGLEQFNNAPQDDHNKLGRRDLEAMLAFVLQKG